MTFPPSFLDELRLRLPLSELIGKRLRLVRAGREFKGCCPFHKEKTPSFYVNDDKQFFHCFGCGAHGDIIGFTMRHDHLSFPEAIEALAAQAGLAVPQDTPVEREKFDREKRLLELLERATVFFEEQLRLPSGREAALYLKGRGLSEEAATRFRLGFAPMDGHALPRAMQAQGFTPEEMMAVGLAKKAEDRPDFYGFFRNRVIFPVGDRRGRTVAFGGRVMGEGEPKYLNSPDHALFHKGQLLYGLSRARAAAQQGAPIIVVEGYMDVIALAEAGFIGALAPLGTALTEDQLALLWKLLPPAAARDAAKDYSPILCFDGDGAGQRAAARAIARALPLLTPAHTARVAYLPEGEDPDSLLRAAGRGAMQSVLDQAKPMVDVLWDLTMENRRLATPEERAGARRALREKTSAIKDETLRPLYEAEMDKRFATLFGPPASKPFFQKGEKYGRQGVSRLAAPLALPRKKPPNELFLREKTLLALLLNHPALAHEFAEDIARIAFSTPRFEALRQEIMILFENETHETLDAAAVYRHLSSGETIKDGEDGLAEILSEATYLHAGFARPSRPIEQARLGWKSIWNKYLQEHLQADLQAATALWQQAPSDANLARLMALRQQAEQLASEQALQAADDEAFFGG